MNFGPAPEPHDALSDSRPSRSAGGDAGDFTRLATAARQYISASYLRENPQHELLHQDLQAAADLPDEGAESSPAGFQAIWESLASQPRILALSYCRMHSFLVENQTSRRRDCDEHEATFIQLQQAREELEDCRAKLKASSAEIALEERSAARNELPYRLGAAILACSRKPGGWLRMPFAAIREMRRPIPKEPSARSQLQKTPNHGKSTGKKDKDDSAIKQQLSYRLGCTLVRHARSPIGWVTLPFALVGETVAFKRKRRKRTGSNKSSKSAGKTSPNDGRKKSA
jgi:hypothetical protein